MRTFHLYFVLSMMMSIVLYSHMVYAQSPREAEIQVERLLQDARSYYDHLEMDPMDEALERILDLHRRFGPLNQRMAQNIGEALILKGLVVFVNNSKDRSGTKRFFIKALQLIPNIQLKPEIKTPTLSSIFDEARREMRSSQGSGGGYNNNFGNGRNPNGGFNSGNGGRNPNGGFNSGNGGRNPNGGFNSGNSGRNPNGGFNSGNSGFNGNGRNPNGNFNNRNGGFNNNGRNPNGGFNNGNGRFNNNGANANGGFNRNNGNGGFNRNGRNGNNQRAPSVPDISHTPPRQLIGGKPFNVRIRVSNMLRPQIYGVRLFYQTRATSGTQQLEMRPTGQTDFEGQVPSTFITGDRLQYYIILYDRSNSPISTYKNNTSPEVLRIVGGRYSNLQGGLLGGNQGSSDASYLSVGFLLGTGVGQITDQATLQNQKGQKVQEGFALAPFHLQLEMDFWFSKNWAVGLFSRLQIIEFSPLGGVHLKWRFVNDQDQKWSLRGGGGYGKVRHLVSLNYQDPTTQMTRKVLDTTLEGPVFYKLGVGYLYQLTSSFSFSMALDFTHLIALNVDDGDSPSLHFDLHFGVVASF